MGTPLALSVDHLSKVYDGKLKALDDVSLSVPQGSFFGLLGPNGAGKTTLINVLGGLTKPSAGSARVMGHDVIEDSMAVRRAIGIVPQEVIFDPFFTARKYLRSQSNYYGIFDNDAWIDELLDNLGLSEQANTNTRKLSGGMKRRLMAAMALVHKPQVVILDEPTAGVDVRQRHRMWSFIRKLNKDGTTVILTTHYLDEAEELCERIAMLNHGKVLADESTQDLLANNTMHARSINIMLEGNAPLPADFGFDCGPATNGDGGRHVIYFDEYAQIEEILASLRSHGARIVEMELSAPDLEDVFVNITDQGK